MTVRSGNCHKQGKSQHEKSQRSNHRHGRCGVSKQFGLVACSGGVVLMVDLFGALLVEFDSRFVSRLASAETLKQASEPPRLEDLR